MYKRKRGVNAPPPLLNLLISYIFTVDTVLYKAQKPVNTRVKTYTLEKLEFTTEEMEVI